MARYEHLPIYKKAMDLAVYLEKVVRNFSRYHKDTLGAELRQKSREIVTAVIAANSRPEKAPLLLQLRQDLEALQVLLRIAKEVRAFANFNSYAYAANLVVDLSRQNEGWLKSQQKQRVAGIPGAGMAAGAGERAELHHGASAPPVPRA